MPISGGTLTVLHTPNSPTLSLADASGQWVLTQVGITQLQCSMTLVNVAATTISGLRLVSTAPELGMLRTRVNFPLTGIWRVYTLRDGCANAIPTGKSRRTVLLARTQDKYLY